MRKRLNLYLAYMRFALTVMAVATGCFYVAGGAMALGTERVLEALTAAKLDAWVPIILMVYVLFRFREQLGLVRH